MAICLCKDPKDPGFWIDSARYCYLGFISIYRKKELYFPHMDCRRSVQIVWKCLVKRSCVIVSSCNFPYLADNPYLEGTKINSPFYLAKLNTPKGTNKFTLIVSQYQKTTTIHYTLKVCAQGWSKNTALQGETHQVQYYKQMYTVHYIETEIENENYPEWSLNGTSGRTSQKTKGVFY